jgi:hypothetical protein
MRWCKVTRLSQQFVILLATVNKNIKRFTYETWIPPLERLSTLPATDDGDAADGANSAEAVLDNDDRIADNFDYCRPIPVMYTNDPKAARRWIHEHLSTNISPSDGEASDGNPESPPPPSSSSSLLQPKIVGWDMESAPNLPWRKPKHGKRRYYGPATIQIGVVDAALVLQIAQSGAGDDKYEAGPIYDVLPVVLGVLADANLIKAGVGIDQDLIELYRWCFEYRDSYAVDDGNNKNNNPFQDLADAFEPSTRHYNIDGEPAKPKLFRIELGGIGATSAGDNVGLGRLVSNILKIDLPKSKKLARSPWADAPLSDIEIAYASRDAWAAAAVFHRLSTLDERQFGPSAIIDKIIVENLPSISELSERAYQRRNAKLEWKGLKEDTRGDMWSPDTYDRIEELEEAMRRLAPPRPTRFDLERLDLF